MAAFGASSVGLSLLPVIALVSGGIVIAMAIRGSNGADVAWRALGALVPATLVAGVVLAVLVVVTERLLDLSRTILFPLYASLFTGCSARGLVGMSRRRRCCSCRP